MEVEGDGNGVAKNDRKVAASGVGAARNGGAGNGRRWIGDGGGGGGCRQHPIIHAYPALLPLPIHAAHARSSGAGALPLPLPPPVLLYLQPPPPLLFPKAAACYGKPNGAPPQRGVTWWSRKPPPPPHAVTAALLPLPQGKAPSFPLCCDYFAAPTLLATCVFKYTTLYWFILLLLQ
jgi:eukaryotic translation initiation factor 2C